MYAYKDVSVPRGRVVHGSRAVVGGRCSAMGEVGGAKGALAEAKKAFAGLA